MKYLVYAMLVLMPISGNAVWINTGKPIQVPTELQVKIMKKANQPNINYRKFVDEEFAYFDKFYKQHLEIAKRYPNEWEGHRYLQNQINLYISSYDAPAPLYKYSWEPGIPETLQYKLNSRPHHRDEEFKKFYDNEVLKFNDFYEKTKKYIVGFTQDRLARTRYIKLQIDAYVDAWPKEFKSK